jgi:hypothetical protein
MLNMRLDHFKRAIVDIAAHGDNDTLPFDIDNRFISDNQDELAEMAFKYNQELEKCGRKYAKNAIDSQNIFSERPPCSNRNRWIPHHHQDPPILEYLLQCVGCCDRGGTRIDSERTRTFLQICKSRRFPI